MKLLVRDTGHIPTRIRLDTLDLVVIIREDEIGVCRATVGINFGGGASAVGVDGVRFRKRFLEDLTIGARSLTSSDPSGPGGKIPAYYR